MLHNRECRKCFSGRRFTRILSQALLHCQTRTRYFDVSQPDPPVSGCEQTESGLEDSRLNSGSNVPIRAAWKALAF
jgi:hypothetical protein